MALPRNSIADFEVANAAYSLSEVTVFIANADGSKGALATLYSSLTGLGTLPNPQTLDNTGKWQQPVYIDNDVILQINSPLDPLLDHDTGIVRFGGRWRGVWTGPGTHYNIDDRILGPIGEAEESNVYKSLSIWDSSGTWATDVADATLLQLELDYQALKTLAMAAVPLASETVAGRIEIATTAEANAGASDALAITPLKLAGRTATETRTGIAEIATQTEVNTGANDTHIVSPAKLNARVASETLQGIIAIGTQTDVDTAANDTEAVTPTKLWTTPMRGGWRNIVGPNGGFEVWQRGAGGSASFAVAASTVGQYTADRWHLTTNALTAMTVSQQAGLADGSRFCTRLQRNAGQTGLFFRFGHPLDADELYRLRGRKVSLQFKARAGADWSPVSGGLLAILYVGQSGVAKRASTPYASETLPINVSTPLTPGGAAVTVNVPLSAAISNAITSAELQFAATFAGTAGANDWIEIDDVDLRVDEPVIDQFERRPFEDELRACMRHFQKSFPYNEEPAQNTGTFNGAVYWRSTATGAVATSSPQIFLPVLMRGTGGAGMVGTLYNPFAANAQVRNITDSTNATLSAFSQVIEKSFRVECTAPAGTAVNEELAVNWSIENGI